MFMKTYDFAETGLNIFGIAVSVTDLNQVLNLVLLIVSVASILLRSAFKIYSLVKERKMKEAIDAIDEAKGELTQIVEKTKGEANEGNNGSDRESKGD